MVFMVKINDIFRNRRPPKQQGMTLIEMIITIVILGILIAMVGMFLRAPIAAYTDAASRADLTDVADTALRRIGRDLHKALPNSIRIFAGECLEFIPTKSGGRYRSEKNNSGVGDVLDFTALSPGDSSFDMLGLNSAFPPDLQITAGDVIAVGNTGTSGVDAYNADNTSTVSSVGAGSLPNETKITFTAKMFPLASASGSKRFQVIPEDEKVVAYVCSGDKLYRTSSTSFVSGGCPTTGAILADNVTDCSFNYATGISQRGGLVTMRLVITQNDESVNLYHEVHVDNMP
jgi:MSHA biogenesis protein MshO